MKKKTILLAAATLSLMVLSGCGEKQEVQETNNAPAQTTSQAPSETPEQKQPQETPSETQGNKVVKTLPDGVVETTVGEVTTYSDDPTYKYFKGANWKDNFDGLVTEIPRVALTDKQEMADGSTVSVVNVKFILRNTTEGKFTTYPDQAVLVTSTGEQIDMPAQISKAIGGEIDKGVMKEGILLYKLERGNADKIKWIKLKWTARKGPEDKLDNPIKKYEIELKIPQ